MPRVVDNLLENLLRSYLAKLSRADVADLVGMFRRHVLLRAGAPAGAPARFTVTRVADARTRPLAEAVAVGWVRAVADGADGPVFVAAGPESGDEYVLDGEPDELDTVLADDRVPAAVREQFDADRRAAEHAPAPPELRARLAALIAGGLPTPSAAERTSAFDVGVLTPVAAAAAGGKGLCVSEFQVDGLTVRLEEVPATAFADEVALLLKVQVDGASGHDLARFTFRAKPGGLILAGVVALVPVDAGGRWRVGSVSLDRLARRPAADVLARLHGARFEVTRGRAADYPDADRARLEASAECTTDARCREVLEATLARLRAGPAGAGRRG